MEKVTIKEVEKIFDYKICRTTASNYINQCRDALNKQKPKILSIQEFCNYFGLKDN